ncbi:hypothetical protein CDIK_4414, partial [Cucumispora dikerogammari]
LDNGIIRTFKANFEKYKLNFILEKVKNEFGVYESYKKLNLVDLITFSNLAWSDVSEKTILNCFNSLYENKNKDLIAKTDLEKIVQDFVKKLIYTINYLRQSILI